MKLRPSLGAALVLVLSLLVPGTALAQDPTPEPGLALPRAVEAAYANGTRSEDGRPGPAYWQNTATHDIRLMVTPPDRTVHATETITYHNDSPHELRAVPIRLYLNAHRPTAMREEVYPKSFLTDGVIIDSFAYNGTQLPWAPDPAYGMETVKVIQLGEPIPPGGQATFEFAWHFDLAKHAQKEGVIDPTTFYLAYFFPRITPLRDNEYGDFQGTLPGFDVEEFTYRSGREVDNDFADFRVSVTLPKDYAMWATGELLNPDEVLQPEHADRLARSMTHDETITIATPVELAEGKVTAQDDQVTWRWKADGVTDFALGLSDHYVWDAASVMADPATGRRVSVQGAYPESATDFASIAQDQRDVVEYGSTQWPGIPWPYPKSTVFVGGADEEYPMMANDSAGSPLPGLPVTPRFVAAHELLHTYFPFLMGVNEQRYPILDEGWTTAFEYLFNAQDLQPGLEDALFAAIRAGNITPAWSGVEIPAITAADSLRGLAASENAYGKASMAYLALRSLLGDDAFRAGLHAFIDRWQGKHPLPWDMFNTFEDVTGEDLTWFWQNWFYSDGYVDLGIAGVTGSDGSHAVEVENTGGFAVPFAVQATYADGSTAAISQDPGVWQDSPNRLTIPLESHAEPMQVVVSAGPFGDAAPADNTWTSPNAHPPSAAPPSAAPPSVAPSSSAP